MKCELCASGDLQIRNYYEISIPQYKRKLAYFVPTILLNLFSKNVYVKKVITNKQFFSRKKIYCNDCNLGYVFPKFQPYELSEYYQREYWEYRDNTEGSHIVEIKNKPKFHDYQLSLHKQRIEFINKYISDYNSVLDFGAGDCSASFIFKKENKAVTAFDYSEKSKHICKEIGVRFASDKNNLPKNDLIYSSHSLEHVEDINLIFKIFLKNTNPGKYLFFETPNIQNFYIFKNLIHTPHTYMLNEKAFIELAKRYDLKIIALELSGSHWSYFKNNNKNCRPDIRVLFQK